MSLFKKYFLNCGRTLDAIHKKIDGIHEQIEKNNAALASTLNEIQTVDEVNEALEKVKSEIPALVDLTNYATKNDIHLVVQSDKVAGDATKLVSSLAYCKDFYDSNHY